GTYAYAGFAAERAMRGVSATIQQLGPLAVHTGHVAGWIGVVDPSTDNAWLQVGLSALPGQSTSAIYYEYAPPGQTPVYHQVETGISVGEPHTFAVIEQPFTPDAWVVWVDGRPVGPPLHLAGSHRWTAQLLGESWAGQRSGQCNAYSYGFANVQLVNARGRASSITGPAIADPNYTVADRTSSGFVAMSFGVGHFRGAEVEDQAAPPAPRGAPVRTG
ncbi:MAG TPA: hypothetical protein VGL44_04895, partial [Gaiellales bacterium]